MPANRVAGAWTLIVAAKREPTLDKSALFDQADVIGIIIPGAGLIFGLSWIFAGPSIGAELTGFQLGSLGILALAALVAGLCLRMIAAIVYSFMRYTPRDRFDLYFDDLPTSESDKLNAALGSAYALKFEPAARTVLYRSKYWQISSLLNLSGQSSLVDRADQQFSLASGLSIAALVVASCAFFGSEPHPWANFSVASFLALVLGTQAGRWANSAAATLIGWFAWLIRQDDWQRYLLPAKVLNGKDKL